MSERIVLAQKTDDLMKIKQYRSYYFRTDDLCSKELFTKIVSIGDFSGYLEVFDTTLLLTLVALSFINNYIKLSLLNHTLTLYRSRYSSQLLEPSASFSHPSLHHLLQA
jgi:hypothetical protein